MFYNNRVTTHIDVEWIPSHRKYSITEKDDHNLPTMPQELASSMEEVHIIKERMWRQIFEGSVTNDTILHSTNNLK